MQIMDTSALKYLDHHVQESIICPRCAFVRVSAHFAGNHHINDPPLRGRFRRVGNDISWSSLRAWFGGKYHDVRWIIYRTAAQQQPPHQQQRRDYILLCMPCSEQCPHFEPSFFTLLCFVSTWWITAGPLDYSSWALCCAVGSRYYCCVASAMYCSTIFAFGYGQSYEVCKKTNWRQTCVSWFIRTMYSPHTHWGWRGALSALSARGYVQAPCTYLSTGIPGTLVPSRDGGPSVSNVSECEYHRIYLCTWHQWRYYRVE